ncbi:ABC transporter permease subunit [Paracraurococcus ruber]|uniref:ABC transporter permease n=1 Tax=Paracraurococcus ruber TaxID=77675 RepID=A0ABS1CUM6_9PROT|nr:ABC transporter permease [Paracraurococcus ruber]TDG29143.1 ABC transporter permease subunit [Paracraurococcus ruber]
MAFILLPLLLVTWLAFFRQEIPAFPPQGYTLHWFTTIPANRAFASGFWLSLQVSVAATTLGLLLAVPASLALARAGFRLRTPLATLLTLPLIVPGVVFGAAFYVGEMELEIATEWPLLGSAAGLVLAHTLLVVPWAMRLVGASLATLNPALEEAARNLGATPFTAFRRVVLPAIRPGVVAGALFGFVTSFGNLEASLFLVGPGQTTLPIAILQYLAWKIDPTVAAVSLLQILLLGTAMLVTDRFVKLSQVV